MMTKRLVLWLSWLFCSWMLPAWASITSLDVTTRTLQALPHCLHYAVQGVCYWQADGVVNTTPYVSHYLPDLVATVFNKPGDNPWMEINETLDTAGGEAEKTIVSTLANDPAGGGQHGFNNPLQQNTFFKEADIIGNPALAALSSNTLLLPSTAIPLTPYYQSMLDSALWRGFSPQADPEQAYAASVTLVRYIGMAGGSVTWGTAVPFEGKIETSNDAKAAAVIAQRASNLTTTSPANAWGHIYQSLSTSCGQECTAATIKENSNDTQFQMIYPVTDSTCSVFGQTVTYGEEAEKQTQGTYAWVLWRKYTGCIQGVGNYIGKTIIH